MHEARLDVVLGVEGERLARVLVGSTRMTGAAAMLAGRTADEVTRLLPNIFSLCGTAQGLAGCRAFEKALGVEPNVNHLRARQALLLAEVVVELGMAAARDWPALLGQGPDLATAKSLRAAGATLRKSLYPRMDWHRVGGGTLEVDYDGVIAALAGLKAAVAALAPELDLDELPEWMAASPAPSAQLLRLVDEAGLAGFGTSAIGLMPASGPADVARRLEQDTDGAYVARPDCGGRVFETGPLARRAAHPALAALAGRHGHGLLTRLAARLVDMVLALQDAEELLQDLGDAGHAEPATGTGAGLGLAEAARGLLIHRVELEDGRVRRYQILAPTEWNFHPEGPLVQGLVGAKAGDGLDWRARALVAALDPCVECSIRVAHPGAAHA
jgi:Ni,Fe-hydrogenase I large subunit